MRRQLVKHGIDTGAEINASEITSAASACRQVLKKCLPEAVIGKNAVDVASHHLAIRGHGTVEAAVNVQNRPLAILAGC